MKRELTPNEVDWVFCWRTSTGEVRPGGRDSGAKRYDPRTVRPERGLRTIMRGRLSTCPTRPTGPRLDEQGARSRRDLFVWGYATHGALVPVRNERELRILEDAARDAILAGDASEWSLAGVGARGGVQWAVRVSQRGQDALAPALVAEMAALVEAPWTLRVEENRVVFLDRFGRVIEKLEADSLFDDAALPPFASQAVEEHVEVRSPMLIRLDLEDETEELGDVPDELGRAMIAWLRSNGVEVVEDEGRMGDSP
ncbi:MAG TPA: hypothetical protein VF316_01310 [Polyangiaceae bacterium]